MSALEKTMVKLVLNKKHNFVIPLEALAAYPDTMLGTMFTTSFELAKKNEKDEYEITANIKPEIFETVLNYYKHGVIECSDSSCFPALRDACDFLQIPFDIQTIKHQNAALFLNFISCTVVNKRIESLYSNKVVPHLKIVSERGFFECRLYFTFTAEKKYNFNNKAVSFAVLCDDPIKDILRDPRKLRMTQEYFQTKGFQFTITKEDVLGTLQSTPQSQCTNVTDKLPLFTLKW